MFIVRYNANGKPDKDFGDNGKVIPSVNSDRAYAEAVAIMPDGKILIAGYSYQAHDIYSSYDYTLLKYNLNGSPDSSFGNNGLVLTDFKDGSENEHASEIVLQQDGKIIVAGTSRDYGESQGIYRTRFICARYNANGTLDNSFGDNGKTRFYFDVDQYDEEAEATSAAIDSKGRIIIAGYNSSYSSGVDAAIARCNPDGSPDLTFGNDGKILADLGDSYAYMKSVLIQPDQKIVIGGSLSDIYLNDQKSIIIRYNENGTIDPDFGTNGVVINNAIIAQNNCHSIALQSNNKIIAAGSSGNAFYVSRYNTDGSLDNSFGANGHLITPMGLLGDSYVEKVNVFNNKIILAGFSHWHEDADITLARYNNDILLSTALQNFFATKKENTTLLQWQTKTEINNNYFTVQRSVGGMNFTDIGIVKGKGSSSLLQQYGFTDIKPTTGINYYRLKQTDDNGNFSYSAVVQIDFSKIIAIKISPNPVQDILTINGLTKTKDLSIIDVSGRIISRTISVNDTYNWNIQHLAAGTYYLVVQDDKKWVTTLKFVKR